jgi:hypothetical protein
VDQRHEEQEAVELAPVAELPDAEDRGHRSEAEDDDHLDPAVADQSDRQGQEPGAGEGQQLVVEQGGDHREGGHRNQQPGEVQHVQRDAAQQETEGSHRRQQQQVVLLPQQPLAIGEQELDDRRQRQDQHQRPAEEREHLIPQEHIGGTAAASLLVGLELDQVLLPDALVRADDLLPLEHHADVAIDAVAGQAAAALGGRGIEADVGAREAGDQLGDRRLARVLRLVALPPQTRAGGEAIERSDPIDAADHQGGALDPAQALFDLRGEDALSEGALEPPTRLGEDLAGALHQQHGIGALREGDARLVEGLDFGGIAEQVIDRALQPLEGRQRLDRHGILHHQHRRHRRHRRLLLAAQQLRLLANRKIELGDDRLGEHRADRVLGAPVALLAGNQGQPRDEDESEQDPAEGARMLTGPAAQQTAERRPQTTGAASRGSTAAALAAISRCHRHLPRPPAHARDRRMR